MDFLNKLNLTMFGLVLMELIGNLSIMEHGKFKFLFKLY
jgi:hypothetical protein